MDGDSPEVAHIKELIAALPREERAMLRPWILAVYDVRGYPVRGYAEPPQGKGFGGTL